MQQRIISIHALREEGDKRGVDNHTARLISIHALREEGDLLFTLIVCAMALISIHALREEGDSKNRERILCFCLIIHLPAQIAKRSL